MKLITDFEKFNMKGKVVRSAIEHGKICIIFDDDTYLVVEQESWSEDCTVLQESELDLYEKRDFGIITTQQYDDAVNAKAIQDENKAKQRRYAEYHKLKKEFSND